jgi:hypothetical protein
MAMNFFIFFLLIILQQMITVSDSQPLRYDELQGFGEDISLDLVADTSIIYCTKLSGKLASEQHSIPGKGSLHPSTGAIQRMQHHPNNLAALKQLDDYGNLIEYNDYLDDEPSRNKNALHQEAVLASHSSPRVSSSTVREGWAHEAEGNPRASASNSHDPVILSEPLHDERKRPHGASTGTF